MADGERVMGVLRERHTEFERLGQVHAVQLDRAEAGAWTVELAVDLRLVLPDGREVLVRKRIAVRATEQRGRRRWGAAGNRLERAASAAGMWPMSGPRK